MGSSLSPSPPLLDPRRPPPPDYYAGNLRYLLDEVARRCADLLSDAERTYLGAYAAAGVPAQRLFARLLARRGPWFRVDGLDYREVADLPAALRELADLGLVDWRPAAPADALLGLWTRPQQQALFPAVRARGKRAWIEACVSRYPDGVIRRRLAADHAWIGLPGAEAFAIFQVLFFGSDENDLSTFVLQDLGVVRFEDYRLSMATRCFADRRELDRYLLCRRLAPWSRRLDEVPAMAEVIARLLDAPACGRAEQRARDRLLNRLGRWHERRDELQPALTCYRRSTSHPARERHARILHRHGDRQGVDELLTAMRREPWAPEEEDFAGRFPGRRPAWRPAVTTCLLRGATPPRIERYAAQLLTANGGRAWHLENLLPLGLAGLCFWDAVFAEVTGAFSHPFQSAPHDLFWPDFGARRRAMIDERIAALQVPGALAVALRQTLSGKRGIANRLVHWGAWTDDLLEPLLAGVPHAALLGLAAHTLHRLGRARTGFPDLLVVYGEQAWELVEVKGPGDQLQAAQRVWLAALRDLGIPARVLRFRAPC